jgi:hypothetical protein
VRVEPVGHVVDGDAAAEVRVTALMTRVAVHLRVPTGPRGVQQRASGKSGADQPTAS